MGSMVGQIPMEKLRMLAGNRRIFGRHLLGREPYVFRVVMRDDKGSVVGFDFKSELAGYSYQYIINNCPAPRRIIVSGRGVGKTEVLVGNDIPYKALVQPYFDQVGNFLARPLPTKIIIVGNVQPTAKKIQERMRMDCLSHPWLSSLVADHSQTELEAKNGSWIYVRTAGNDGSSARGLHSQILENERGQSVKGKIHIYLDEAAFMRAPRIVQEVVEPMMMLNPHSTVTITTTPWGDEGETPAIWNDKKSTDCMQLTDVRRMMVERMTANGERIYREEPFAFYPTFDPAVCKACLKNVGWKKFNVATADNPYMVPEALWERKQALIRNGLEVVWNQEHMGIFQKAAGLFFPPMTWQKMIDDSLVFLSELEVEAYPGKRKGRFMLGLDSSSGIVSKGADFTAAALWEEVSERGELHYYLRGLWRWKRPPDVWNGRKYDETMLLNFVVDFARFLRKKLSILRTTIGSGFGQGLYTTLNAERDDGPVDYFTDQETQLTSLFVWFRALGEMGRCHLPSDAAPGGTHEWLSQEAGRLGITEGTARGGLNFKVYKMAGWGSGKTVDGLFAMAYGLAPTVQLMSALTVVKVQRSESQDSVREVGGGLRELSVNGVRELSVN